MGAGTRIINWFVRTNLTGCCNVTESTVEGVANGACSVVRVGMFARRGLMLRLGVMVDGIKVCVEAPLPGHRWVRRKVIQNSRDL